MNERAIKSMKNISEESKLKMIKKDSIDAQ